MKSPFSEQIKEDRMPTTRDMNDLQNSPIGVIIMAYGTPAGPEQIEAYYTHIRRGRKPSPEHLADLQHRYRSIGGVSPLIQHTRDQINGIQAALDAISPGRFCTTLGMKHSAPFIEDGVQTLVQHGVQRIIGLVLAPHYSSMSVGEYMRRARSATPPTIPFSAIESWHLAPSYLTYLKNQVLQVKARLLHERGISEEKLEVIFTAHSLPTRILQMGDPYPTQLQETAQAVAEAANLQHWSVAWQSAGRTAEPWLGPSILEVLQDLPHKRVEGVVVCPAGFVSDHLEILYDLDIEASQLARSLDLAFARTALPNADQQFVRMLAGIICAHLG
jgi:ferrochelatase